MTKILLILSALFIIACGEKVSTDTVQVSKEFMKALIVGDEKTIDTIKHPWHDNSLNTEHSLKRYPAFFKEHSITAEELTYTMQKGKTAGVECVVVQSNGTRVDVKGGELPRVHWRLKYTSAEKKEGLFLQDMDIFYGNFIDKGCIE